MRMFDHIIKLHKPKDVLICAIFAFILFLFFTFIAVISGCTPKHLYKFVDVIEFQPDKVITIATTIVNQKFL